MEARIRHVGVDVGNTRSRIYLTASDSETGALSDLRPVIYDNQPYLNSTVWIDAAGNQAGILKQSADLLKNPGWQMTDLDLVRNIKAGVAIDRSVGIDKIVSGLLDGLKSRLRIETLPPDQFQITVGVPSSWNKLPYASQMLTEALRPHIDTYSLYPDAHAALLAAAYSGLLPVQDRPQSWIVMDIGGRFTTFSLVKKTGNEFKLDLVGVFPFDWGGDQLDLDLRVQWFFATFGQQVPKRFAENIASQELLMQDLKEKLSKSRVPIEADYSVLGIKDPVILSREVFDIACAGQKRRFATILADKRLSTTEWESVDLILIVGGSAVWDFVRQSAVERWGVDRVVCPDAPDTLVGKGLALAFSGYQPEPASAGMASGFEQHGPIPYGKTIEDAANPNEREETVLGSKIDKLTSETLAAEYGMDKKTVHQKIRKMIFNYAIACALVALVLAWLPFAAWPILLAIEVYMLVQIANIYGYRYSDGLFISMALGLLALSLVLSTLLAPVTETVLCVFKPILAGLIVWGIGEGAIAILDWDSARQG